MPRPLVEKSGPATAELLVPNRAESNSAASQKRVAKGASLTAWPTARRKLIRKRHHPLYLSMTALRPWRSFSRAALIPLTSRSVCRFPGPQ
jgi:hypothetical protein